MTVEEIQEKMAAIISGADAREPEKRSLQPDEIAQYEDLEKQLKAVKSDGELRSRHDIWVSAKNAATPASVRADAPDPEIEVAFEHYLRTGQRNSDLAPLAFAQGEGTPSAGGYTVPDGFRQKLVERMRAFGGIATKAESFTTDTGNPVTWPAIDDTSNTGEIIGENAAGSGGSAGADMQFTQVSLGAYKYMSLGTGNEPLKVSVELLQDSAFDVVALVTRLLGKRIARKQATHFAQGTGSGQPLGLNYAIPTVELATGNAITTGKLLDAIHAVDPDYRQNASWVFNDTTLKVIRQLVDNQDRPLWLPSIAGLSGTLPGGSLMGYPVTIDQAMPNIANGTHAANDGFAVFGDIEEAYVVRNVRDVVVIVDPYSSAKNGQVEFTAWARADGTVQNAFARSILAGFDAS